MIVVRPPRVITASVLGYMFTALSEIRYDAIPYKTRMRIRENNLILIVAKVEIRFALGGLMLYESLCYSFWVPLNRRGFSLIYQVSGIFITEGGLIWKKDFRHLSALDIV